MKIPTSRVLRPLTFIISILTLCVGTSFAQAEQALKWEETSLAFDAGFGQEKVVATYNFSNVGEKTVTIVDAKASCGCTVPSLDKKVYEPGETGELDAIFTIGSRVGHQHKTITVTTFSGEESNTQTYSLELDVEIPTPVTLKPRVRFWKIGSDAATQEVRISLAEGFPMKITGILRKDADLAETFDYKIETVVDQREYILKITPKAANSKSRDVLFLTSDDDTLGILSKFPVYAYVR